jgi:hypothetical protein
MFSSIRSQILADIAEVDECYQPLVAESSSIRPYCVIQYGNVQADTNLFGNEQVYVIVYTDDYNAMYDLTKKVAASVTKVNSLHYIGTSGNPFFDPNLDCWMNTLVFNVAILIR